ncbi:hypothetical protein OH76DRAFT_543625 [Lentinus brumalis]|uniref:Secreted protein n=1 Tax=Lentinus brumalis TaxID=2498619 RepID=A0A371D9S1_9APHY|nr:hypothetical protein OH76DRAFT_543625 [Polyporus brumalis]
MRTVVALHRARSHLAMVLAMALALAPAHQPHVARGRQVLTRRMGPPSTLDTPGRSVPNHTAPPRARRRPTKRGLIRSGVGCRVWLACGVRHGARGNATPRGLATAFCGARSELFTRPLGVLPPGAPALDQGTAVVTIVRGSFAARIFFHGVLPSCDVAARVRVGNLHPFKLRFRFRIQQALDDDEVRDGVRMV